MKSFGFRVEKVLLEGFRRASFQSMTHPSLFAVRATFGIHIAQSRGLGPRGGTAFSVD